MQLVFAKKMLYKSYDNKKFRKIELVKIRLRTLIINMFDRKIWSKVLIFAIFVFILIIFVYLVRAFFSIFKVKSDIYLEYIIKCHEKILKRSISDTKSFLKLLLSSKLHK